MKKENILERGVKDKERYLLYKNCLESALRLQKREIKIKEKLDALQNVLCPGQYPVFLDSPYVPSFIEGVRYNNEKLANDISHYMYEVMNMEEYNGSGVSGKVYNCKDIHEYILFCLDS